MNKRHNKTETCPPGALCGSYKQWGRLRAVRILWQKFSILILR